MNNSMHYNGLDIHKRRSHSVANRETALLSNEVKSPQQEMHWQNGCSKENSHGWQQWKRHSLPTGWIYDFLLPHCPGLKVANPQMLKAITAGKKKNDRDDAERIADLLRCNLLPESYMAPGKIRELRRILRYRNLLVRESVKMKNKTSGLLMEVGAPHNKQRLHGKKCFAGLLDQLDFIPDSVVDLLKICRMNLELFNRLQKKLLGEPLLNIRRSLNGCNGNK